MDMSVSRCLLRLVDCEVAMGKRGFHELDQLGRLQDFDVGAPGIEVPAHLHQSSGSEAHDRRTIALGLHRLAWVEDVFFDSVGDGRREPPYNVLWRFLEDAEGTLGKLLQ